MRGQFFLCLLISGASLKHLAGTPPLRQLDGETASMPTMPKGDARLAAGTPTQFAALPRPGEGSTVLGGASDGSDGSAARGGGKGSG